MTAISFWRQNFTKSKEVSRQKENLFLFVVKTDGAQFGLRMVSRLHTIKDSVGARHCSSKHQCGDISLTLGQGNTFPIIYHFYAMLPSPAKPPSCITYAFHSIYR